MKATYLADCIRIDAETTDENPAVGAIHDLIFHSSNPVFDKLADNAGCCLTGGPDCEALNYCHIPTSTPIDEEAKLDESRN